MIQEYIRYIKDNPDKYWFKAKLYGWGWTPARWQGWVVLATYIAVIIVPSIVFADRIEGGGEFVRWFPPLIFIATAILIGICYKKGEKPRWQWGLPKEEK